MKNIYMGVVVPLTIILPVFVALIRFRHLPRQGKVILFYLLMSSIVNIAATTLAKQKMNNLPLSHIYTFIEFIFLAEFYKIVLGEKKLITGLQLFFLLACVLNTIFFQDIYKFNSYTRSLEALIIMLLSVNFFAKMFTDHLGSKLLNNEGFWFNTGMFLYFSGAFMLFIFSNFILQASSKSFNIIWNLHATFVLIMYILFTLGFIKCKK